MTRVNPPSIGLLWLGVSLLLWLLYTAVFFLTDDTRGALLPIDAAANVLPLVLLAAAVHRLLGDAMASRPVGRQALLHLELAPALP